MIVETYNENGEVLSRLNSSTIERLFFSQKPYRIKCMCSSKLEYTIYPHAFDNIDDCRYTTNLMREAIFGKSIRELHPEIFL